MRDDDALTTLLTVLDRFRDCDPHDPIAMMAAADGATVRLTYGNLMDLAGAVISHRSRANQVARTVADLRDELDAVRSELADLRETHARVAIERDRLSVALDTAQELADVVAQRAAMVRGAR